MNRAPAMRHAPCSMPSALCCKFRVSCFVFRYFIMSFDIVSNFVLRISYFVFITHLLIFSSSYLLPSALPLAAEADPEGQEDKPEVKTEGLSVNIEEVVAEFTSGR